MLIKKPSAKLTPLEARILRTIREYSMLIPGEHVIVAASGGADSTALLLCLHALMPVLDCSLTVAHLNHRLRGHEGNEDEAFVRRMSARLALPFRSDVIDVKEYAVSARLNLEQAAREKRYDFLRRTAANEGAQKIAVGHNQDDQAETALFRFLRGSGIEGLSSIHPVVDDQVIRPLLECSRGSILEYLKQRGCRYREDSTNTDLRFSRNRIRNELIPYLEKNFNPKLSHTVAREALLMRETWSFLNSQALKTFEGMYRSVNRGIALKIEEILALHPALQKQVLRCALRHCLGSVKGIGLSHVDSLLSLCGRSQSGGWIQMPRKIVALRQFDELLLLRGMPELHAGFHYELQVPGTRHVPEAGGTLHAEICRSRKYCTEKVFSNRASFDPAVLQNPLVVRSRIPGDRYGGPGHRKVKRMLIDRKIPLIQRNVLPMVVSGEDVIWIPGFRPARVYGVKDPSKPFVLLEFVADSE
jgi:tRNA(Ile)-lysidine synthase